LPPSCDLDLRHACLAAIVVQGSVDAAKNLPGAPHLVAAMLLALAIMVALRAAGSAGVPPPGVT
jgi:hypothetical protein